MAETRSVPRTESRSQQLLSARRFSNRLSLVVGGMCVVCTSALVVTGVFTGILINYLLAHPEVCDAVFENFLDFTTVPEIDSISLNGVINPLAEQLRHAPGNDFISPSSPITITFDPNNKPSYVGVTAESVGRNGFRITRVSCGGLLSASVPVLGDDVDEGSQAYLVFQKPEICGVSISQELSLPGDGIGITQVAMAYNCSSTGVVANLAFEPLRYERIAEVGGIAGVVGALLLIFIALTAYRNRRLKTEVVIFAALLNSADLLENGITAKHLHAAQASQARSPVQLIKASFSKTQEAFAKRRETRRQKKEQDEILLANRKVELHAKKEAAKEKRRLLHQQHAQQQRQALPQPVQPLHRSQVKPNQLPGAEDIF